MEEFLSRVDLLSRVWVKMGNLTGGIDFPQEKFCYIIWDGDIFGTPKKKKRKRKHPMISVSRFVLLRMYRPETM